MARRLLRSKRTHPSGTHMFSPLSAMVRSSTKRKRISKSGLAKGKRARADTTVRGKSAVKSLPKNRIGKDQGLIVSNQRVPRPKSGSVQYRRSTYGSVAQDAKAWLGGSSIGTQSVHFRTIAHAILAHYLIRMGDLRANNDQQVPTNSVFKTYRLGYAKDAPGENVQGGDLLDGQSLSNKSLTDMATELGDQLSTRAIAGLYPLVIAFFDNDTGAAQSAVLRDYNLGRHVITMSIKGRFRFQNIMPAGDAALTNSTNINAVDANPVNGKIYTFRNQAPLFLPGYISAEDAATQAGVQELQTVVREFDMYGGSGSSTARKGGAAFIHLAAPPLNPRSIWRNVNTVGNVVFPPGGFKTFTTSYLRSESIAKYCQVISQTDQQNPNQTYSHNMQYPPAGDSFMMCLRPTIKTIASEGQETVQIAWNTEHILMASLKRTKARPLQVVNLIQ